MITVGELIRELSYWSPDTPVSLLTPRGELDIGHVIYGETLQAEGHIDVNPGTLYITEYEGT